MIIYGHRGAQGESPENTIAGLRHGIERGVRHVEIDLRLSKDKQLVVIHDERLKRTTGVRGKVSGLTAAELARLDARGSGTPWPGKKAVGVPTLNAMYESCPEILSWQLELKGAGSTYNANLVAALSEWLADDSSDCIVTSSDPALIMAMKQLLPDLQTGFVSMYPDPSEILEECACSHIIAQWTTVVNPFMVRRLHRKGIHISTWTVNDASAIKNLYRLKVDSVITDYPSMALPLVASLER